MVVAAYVEEAQSGAGVQPSVGVVDRAERPGKVALDRLAGERISLGLPVREIASLEIEIENADDLWQTGTLATASHPAARVELINWLLAEGLPFSGAAGKNGLAEMAAQLAALLQQYQQAEAKLPTPKRAMAMADGTPITFTD